MYYNEKTGNLLNDLALKNGGVFLALPSGSWRAAQARSKLNWPFCSFVSMAVDEALSIGGGESHATFNVTLPLACVHVGSVSIGHVCIDHGSTPSVISNWYRVSYRQKQLLCVSSCAFDPPLVRLSHKAIFLWLLIEVRDYFGF